MQIGKMLSLFYLFKYRYEHPSMVIHVKTNTRTMFLGHVQIMQNINW